MICHGGHGGHDRCRQCFLCNHGIDIAVEQTRDGEPMFYLKFSQRLPRWLNIIATFPKHLL